MHSRASRNQVNPVSSTSQMETLLADLRYALRTMRRNLGFTAIALAALALGIGANTAIFTVVDAVLLQPLPYPQPDRIMKLGRQFRTGVGYSNSIPKYMAWRQNDVFDAMALYDFGALAMNVGSGNPPQSVKASPRLCRLLQGLRRFADRGSHLLAKRGSAERPGRGRDQLWRVAISPRRHQRGPRAADPAERRALHGRRHPAEGLSARPGGGCLDSVASGPEQHQSGPLSQCRRAAEARRDRCAARRRR